MSMIRPKGKFSHLISENAVPNEKDENRGIGKW